MRLSKNEVRLRALKAAAGVALFTGAVACGELPTQNLAGRGSPHVEPADEQLTPDAGATTSDAQPSASYRDATARTEVVPPDAGLVAALDSGLLDSGVEVADAGDTDAESVDAGDNCFGLEGTGEDWFACCERIGWDWNRGCQAWGPPVPPEARAEVV
ncbi:MAG: hypothetical protein HY791_02170 [Deltaproteobacteria bacterium]|nr:hypothetical protein [Deltaproteobacteria bacterium]